MYGKVTPLENMTADLVPLLNWVLQSMKGQKTCINLIKNTIESQQKNDKFTFGVLKGFCGQKGEFFNK